MEIPSHPRPSANSDNPPLIGIFVGGQSRRFGFRAKGLLKTVAGITLVEHLRSICRAACPKSPLLLVGGHSAYACLGIEQLEDNPSGVGPMGGLRALLLRAQARGGDAIALACDLPALTSNWVRALAEDPRPHAVLAPFADGFWQPLVARYRPDQVLPVLERSLRNGELSLRRLFESGFLDVAELSLTPSELPALTDCDTPELARAMGLTTID